MKVPENNELPAVAAGMGKISLEQLRNEQNDDLNVTDGRIQQPTKVVAYVRMSTDHQDQSIDNQLEIIGKYAQQNSMQITKVYADEGKSGLSVKGRNDFQRLIEDVHGKARDFSYVLVHDTSRWGRFPDSAESLYYEFLCKKAGVKVHFCGEGFRNDDSMESALFKDIKYHMASAYSKDLSVKVFHGSSNLARQGYRQGGSAGYGLRRQLLDEQRQPKMILNFREKKSIQTERVILVPGSEEEVRRVKWIYETFVFGGKSEKEIALRLNEEGVLTDFGRPWTRAVVHEILTKEKYIGHNVYNQTSGKLKGKRVRNSEELWVRKDNAFQGIIEPKLFHMAQGIIVRRSLKMSDDEMLGKLRMVLEANGHLTGFLIDEMEDMPSSAVFRHRFGSLVRAYQLIGYQPPLDYSFITTNRELRQQYANIVTVVREKLVQQGIVMEHDTKNDLFTISGELQISIVVSRHQVTASGMSRWLVRLDTSLEPDLTIAVRMNATNDGIYDYYLLPAMDMTMDKLKIAERNGVFLDAYRHDSLDYFFYMTERVKIITKENK
jgi:DNA invertase Pin-like site-specific DNA recombinase